MEIMNYGAAVAAAATAAALHFYCYICFAPAHAAAAAAKTNRAPTNKKINSARQLIFGRCFQLFFSPARLGLIWPRALNKLSPLAQTESRS